MMRLRNLILLIIVIAFALSLTGCKEKSTEPILHVVATPEFDVSVGTYPDPFYVKITCLTSDTTIRYTLNGTEPTESSTAFADSLQITATTTIKAKGFREGWTASQTASATYAIGYAAAQMITIPGGSFNNGTSNVTLSSFQISNFEVTQAQYLAVMGSNPSQFSQDTGRPVENVSWFNAIEYCNKRSMQESLTPSYSYTVSGTEYGTNPANWPAGWKDHDENNMYLVCNWSASGYRLPSEMEWMYAARGGSQSLNYTYSGSNVVTDVAWYSDNSQDRTHKVGTKLPNELGLYDMSGNVWELVWDIFADYPSGNQNNPHGSSEGLERVLRCGSWKSGANLCLVTHRGSLYPTGILNTIGFRVARNPL